MTDSSAEQFAPRGVLNRVLDGTRVPKEVGHFTVDLSAAGKALAAGFTLLTSLLTFFGIKEGVLDRILRSDPQAALLVFCLVGVAVIAGAASPLLNPQATVGFHVLVLAAAALGAWVQHVLPDIVGDETANVAHLALGGAGAVAVAFLFRKTRVPFPAAALFVGATCLTYGLYGATKLSVDSKRVPVSPDVAAEVIGTGTDRTVAVSVTGGRLDDRHYLVVGIGPVDAPSAPLWRAVVFPDATGSVSRTLNFKLADGNVTSVVVWQRRCVVPKPAAKDAPKGGEASRTGTPVGFAAAGAPQLPAPAEGGSGSDEPAILAPEACVFRTGDARMTVAVSEPKTPGLAGSVGPGDTAGTIKLHVALSGLRRGDPVGIRLRKLGDQSDLFMARVIADVNGAASWDGATSVTDTAGSVLTLEATCYPPTSCPENTVTLAIYSVPTEP